MQAGLAAKPPALQSHCTFTQHATLASESTLLTTAELSNSPPDSMPCVRARSNPFSVGQIQALVSTSSRSHQAADSTISSADQRTRDRNPNLSYIMLTVGARSSPSHCATDTICWICCSSDHGQQSYCRGSCTKILTCHKKFWCRLPGFILCWTSVTIREGNNYWCQAFIIFVDLWIIRD